VADELKGEVPLGLVVLKSGVTASGRPCARSWSRWCATRSARWPCSSASRWCNRLPKTRSGKILRAVMRKIADNEAYQTPATIDDPAILDEIRKALQDIGYATNLVERRPNLGARVITLSNDQLLEIYVIREALEGMAARIAAERMSEAAIAELKALLTRHRNDIAQADWQIYFQEEGDLDFHFRIVQGSGNRRLIDILCNDLYHLARMYRCQFGMKSDRAADALKEHELVVDAIAERDGELAEWLMRRHIRASRRAVERRLQIQT
jgi:DNA-binding GntR family transcriptional regulator